MQIKINNATKNRPEGHRLIDAPAVQINTNDYITQLRTEKAWETSDRNAITVFKTHGFTIVISALHKGATISDLQVEGLLTIQVMEGAISISTDGTETTLSPQQMLVLHTAPASDIVAVEDCILQLSYIKTITAPEDSVI